MQTDTAHEHWDQQWSTEAGRADWIEPEPFIIEALSEMHRCKIRSVLDLGCGPGRHALFLAERGFDVQAIDASRSAVEVLQRSAAERNLTVATASGKMTELNFSTASLDMVLAWNVIYHGDLPIVQRSLAEINRVLRPGGLFVGSMLSKRNSEVLGGREIAYSTFINEDRSDKNHPHFYCNAAQLVGLFTGFEFLLLQDAEHHGPGSGSWHWQFIAEKQ